MTFVTFNVWSKCEKRKMSLLIYVMNDTLNIILHQNYGSDDSNFIPRSIWTDMHKGIWCTLHLQKTNRINTVITNVHPQIFPTFIIFITVYALNRRNVMKCEKAVLIISNIKMKSEEKSLWIVYVFQIDSLLDVSHSHVIYL